MTTVFVDPQGRAASLGPQLRPRPTDPVLADELSALALLSGARPLSVLLVLPGLGRADALHLIQSVRLMHHRAALPIAVMIPERDFGCAAELLRAGATEIFLASDSAALVEFVAECRRRDNEPAVSGRVLLLEDSPVDALVVSQLCSGLGLEVDDCRSLDEAVARLPLRHYHLAIVDIMLGDLSTGLTLVRQVRQTPGEAGRLPILVVSAMDDSPRRIEALRSGADDFLHKPFVNEELVFRVRRLLSADGADGLADERAAVAPILLTTGIDEALRAAGLSAREREVCAALLRGATDKAIARELDISFWTVRTHLQRLFAKLGVMNRRELMTRYLSAAPSAAAPQTKTTPET